MPVWLLALQIALQATPAIVQAIDFSKLPGDLTNEQVAALVVARDKAIAEFEAAATKTG